MLNQLADYPGPVPTLLFGPKAKHLETIESYTFLVALHV